MEITQMDALAEKITQVQAEIADLEDQIESKKQSIADIKKRVEEYFIETNRTAPYQSPYGTLFLRQDTSVIQPKGENLKALFEHFEKIHGTDGAWARMSIHQMTLKSELKQHAAAVEERGGDILLEPLPGVEAPKIFKKLQFRKGKANG